MEAATRHLLIWKSWITVFVQLLLTGIAAWMSLRADVPVLGRVGIVLMGLGAVTLRATGFKSGWLGRWVLLVGWVLSLLMPASLFLPFESSVTLEMYLNKYLAVISWVVAAAVVPASCAPADSAHSKWRLPAFIWSSLATVLWLGTTYLYNYPEAFFPAVAVLAALLVLAQLCFRLPEWGIQAANTMLLLVIGLVAVDGWFRPPSRLDTELAPEKRYYSYEVARRDPAGFARWWKLFGERFETMGRELYIKDPAHKVRFRLKPNGRSKLFQSEIRVNSRGFRGPEFTSPKADVYRIVCLGESTTFGCTLTANDRPWPEVLQEKIGSRLKLSRPVEVVNAGIPSFTLANTLDRLEPDILPLKPDILISYHGYNGFSMLHDSFPSTSVSAPPGYIARPLRLLALAEYRARLLWFKRELTAELKREPPSVSDVLDTPYAHDYGRLIHFARTNGIRLVLATHALAVNKDSDRDVIEFYRAGFPAVHWLIKANRLHSALVEHLSALHPGVGSVDAGRGLDGQHEKFIDLVHLTQEGRETLAETMFQAIRQELESTLRPDAANSTMAGGAERSQ